MNYVLASRLCSRVRHLCILKDSSSIKHALLPNIASFIPFYRELHQVPAVNLSDRITPKTEVERKIFKKKQSKAATKDSLKIEKTNKVNQDSAEMHNQSTKSNNPSRVAHSLRAYQQECIDASLEALKQGIRRMAVSLPVGSGKTVVFSNLINKIPPWSPKATKVLVLAHRDELLYQAKAQIQRHNPELVVEVDQGANFAPMSADVIIASVPTLGKKLSDRIERYDPYDFKCIIIDEAHHAAASSYRTIRKYFDVSNKNTKDVGPMIWGCSATLSRHDGLSLDHMFDKIVYERGFLDMILEKWLCEIVTISVRTRVSMDSVKTRGHDFELKSLNVAINTGPRNKLVVDKYIELAQNDPHGPRRSTIVFGMNVSHVKMLEKEFRSRGIDARHIVGKTDKSERVMLVENFKKGKFPVLINCEILTEGADIPNIDCLIMARPTRSGVLFQQMVGRGVRLHPSKKNCLIIDFVDSFTKENSLVNIPSLLGLNPDEQLDNVNITSEDFLKKVKGRQTSSGDDLLEDINSPEYKLRVIYKKLADPYAVFKTNSQDLNEMRDELELNPRYNNLLGSALRADTLTCGDPLLITLSPLSWVAISEDLYVLETRTVHFFIERKFNETSSIEIEYSSADGKGVKPNNFKRPDSENEPHDKIPSKYKYSAYCRKVFKSSKHSRRVMSHNITIDLTAHSLPQAIKSIDTYVGMYTNYKLFQMLHRSQNWRKDIPSEGQIRYLLKLGIPKLVLDQNMPGFYTPSYDNIKYLPKDMTESSNSSRRTGNDRKNTQLARQVSSDLLIQEDLTNEQKEVEKFYKDIGLFHASPSMNSDGTYNQLASFPGSPSRVTLNKGAAANLITRLAHGSGAVAREKIESVSKKQKKKEKEEKKAVKTWLK